MQLDEGLKKTIAYFDKLLTRAAATHASPTSVRPSTRRVNGRDNGGRRAVLAA